MQKAITLVALGIVIASVPAAAQEHRQGQVTTDSAGHGMMHCPGMVMMGGMMTGTMQRGDRQMMPGGTMEGAGWMVEAMRLSPRYLLVHKDDLDLSEAQVARIEAIRRHQGMDTDRMAVRSLHQRLQRAFEATPADTAALRSMLEQLATLTARVHGEHLAAAASARAILTPAQRAAFDQLPVPCPMMDDQAKPAARDGHEQHHDKR